MSGELGQNEKTCDMGPCLTKKFDKIVDSIDAIVLPLFEFEFEDSCKYRVQNMGLHLLLRGDRGVQLRQAPG